MTNKLNLKSFFFLLPVSCLVSGSLSLGLQDTNPQNTTTYTQYNNETEFQSTSGPPQGNGTSGNLFNVEGSETNSTKHQSVGYESSPRTSFSETKGSSNPVTPSSAPTLSSSLGRNRTNATNSAPIVRTTGNMVTDERSTSRTTKPVAITFTEIKTTPNPQPTKPHSTQKTATKVCATAEPKRENLVGRCLIAIGSLAAITTIFIMTTIILATKLSGSRHRASLLHETEMVCISTLMSDSDHPVPTPRHPKSNGALIPVNEDEDGDDLTLNSFLHDTEGMA